MFGWKGYKKLGEDEEDRREEERRTEPGVQNRNV